MRGKRQASVSLYAGAAVVAVFVIVAIFAPFLSVHSPFQQNLTDALARPSARHWFGVDQIGRDVFARVLFGARYDVSIAIIGVGLAYIIALPFGLASGYFRGKTDAAIAMISDSVLTFPSLVLAIIVVSIIGSSLTGLILTIALTQAPALVRYIRSFVLQIRDMDYIDAALIVGVRHRRIMFVHILRNTVGPTMVILSLTASEAILTAAALGFLGVGVQPPNPEWGTMLNESRTYFVQDPLLMVFSGVAIALLVLGFNLLGDGLRDYFDTRH